jgi:exopolysaccharide biosynthesis polyprenyl glycosylphosphotransferase
MISSKRRLLIKAYKIFDFFVMSCAFVFASIITALTNTPVISLSEFLSMRIKIQNLLILGLFFILWLFIFKLIGIHRSRRLEGTFQGIFDILKATTISTSLLLAFGFILNISLINQIFLITFWAGSSLLMIVSRIILRIALKNLRLKGHNLRHIVIIGTGEHAQKFAKKLSQSNELGYHILGFVDDQWEGLVRFNNNKWNLLTDLKGFQELLMQKVIDEVFISLPLKSYYDKINTVIKLCEDQGITIRFISDIFELKIAKSYIDQLGDTSILTLQSSPIEEWSFILKRFFDISVSFILLIFLAPLFLLVAVLIKIESKGPVFFIQERMGYNKRRFKMIKFRTMLNHAEGIRDKIEHLNEVTGPVFKIKNDPRVTRVGKLLRKTSFDEVPQLINVLKGEMSLVGPRPLPLRDYEGFNTDWHRRRFSIRPGITCLWQINGRSNIPFDKWMELDKEYIDNWSLLLDLKILVKTIPVVLRGTGAV